MFDQLLTSGQVVTITTMPEGQSVHVLHGIGGIKIEESNGQGGWVKIHENRIARNVTLAVTNATWRVTNYGSVSIAVSMEVVITSDLWPQLTAQFNLVTGDYTDTRNSSIFGGVGNLHIPDKQGIRWLKRNGTLSDAGIFMWEDHDTNGGELIFGAPWRIAFTNYGPTQLGPNDPGRYPRAYTLASGYSAASPAALNYMPSGAFGWETSAWTGSASVRNTIYSQAKALDATGANSILQFFDQASVNESGNNHTPGRGDVAGNLIAEIYKDGLWSRGTAPAFVVISDSSTLTLTCSKYKSVQSARVTLGGNRTLVLSGLIDGMRGVLYVQQDVTGSRTLVLPANSAMPATFALSSSPLAIDRLSWEYDGTFLYWSITNGIELPLDPDAASFLTAAAISNTTQKSAVNSLVLALKNVSLWDKIYALYPYVGGTASSHARDLRGAYHGTFGGTVTQDANGITGSTNGFFNSGFVPSSVGALNSIATYCYSRTATPTAGGYLIGATGASTSRIGILVSGANLGLAGINANNISGAASAGGDFRKHLGAQRTDASNCQLIVNAAPSSNIAVPSNVACNAPITFLARNTSGSYDLFSNANLGAGMISQHLTTTEWTTFLGIMDTYQQALSRKNP